MDAFDIFKKLTKGAKFNTKRSLNYFNDSKAKKIKLEKKEDNISSKTENINDENDFKEMKIENEFEDRELRLLGSITATQSGSNNKVKTKKNEVTDEKKKHMLEQEEVNRYRNENKINVVGRHVPPAIKEFDDLNFGADLIKNVKKCGYETPTPIQKQAIPLMLKNRQILACAPTGSGKTAAFLIPIIHALEGPKNEGFRAVIVCPTRELAKQTQRECARLAEGRGFRIHIISKINQALTQYGQKSNKKFDILVTTPNRLCFLLNQDPPAISLANVQWVVIDEADKLFESGVRGFRDQLDQIMNACSCSTRRVAMFSATQTVDVGRWCRRYLKGLVNITVGQRNAATDLVDQELLFVGDESGKLVALRGLAKTGLAPPVLVFVESKERAQQLFSELVYDGINVDVIHANRTQLQRNNTVRCFREGKIWVLICTELMARGVDFKGVNLVINYDFPPSAIAYIHRVGRAGRAGRRGRAITFFTLDDTPNLRAIAHVLRQSGCKVPEYMLKMKKQRSKKEKLAVKKVQRQDISTSLKHARRKLQQNDDEK